MVLFVDTSAFIALIDKADQYHEKAKFFVEDLKKKVTFHTTNYIIDETITRLGMTAGYKPALYFGEMIFSSNIYRIHYIDKELERLAFDKFRKFSDKELSFTDCTSFALMERADLKKAFAFDEDFQAVGFQILPH